MEELAARPNEIMREILEYLEVDSDFQSPAWTNPRNPKGARRRPHAFFRRLMKTGTRPERWVSEHFPASLYGPITRLIHATGSPIEKPRLDANQEMSLVQMFSDDVRKLRAFAGKDFVNWRDY